MGLCQKLSVMVPYVKKKIKKSLGDKPPFQEANPLQYNNVPIQFGHDQKLLIMVLYDVEKN